MFLKRLIICVLLGMTCPAMSQQGSLDNPTVIRGSNSDGSINVGNGSGGNTPTNPSYVQPPLPSSVITGTVAITTTGTAVQLPSNTLLNGLIVSALPSNSGQTSTYSGKVGSSTVTTVISGSSNLTTGYPLAPGQSSSFAVPNSNLLYVNGTAGDIFSYEGN